VTVEASDGLSVIVRDTGVGIAVERLPAILERFMPINPACPIAPAGRVSAAGDPADGAARRPSHHRKRTQGGNDGAGNFPKRPDRISVIPDRRSGGLLIRRPQSL